MKIPSNDWVTKKMGNSPSNSNWLLLAAKWRLRGLRSQCKPEIEKGFVKSFVLQKASALQFGWKSAGIIKHIFDACQNASFSGFYVKLTRDEMLPYLKIGQDFFPACHVQQRSLGFFVILMFLEQKFFSSCVCFSQCLTLTEL